MKATEIAYLAGYFDGEGCVSVTSHRYKDKVYLTRTLVFAQNSKEYCELFSVLLGAGRVYKTSKYGYQWRANGKDAVKAASLLYPYLRLKREQVWHKILQCRIPDV